MLLISDSEARGTRVEVRAVQAFVAITPDPRVAEVASCIVNVKFWRRHDRRDWSGLWGWNIVVMNDVHNNLPRLSKLNELVVTILVELLHTLVHTRLAQVEVRTVQTLVPRADDNIVTLVAANAGVQYRTDILTGATGFFKGTELTGDRNREERVGQVVEATFDGILNAAGA